MKASEARQIATDIRVSKINKEYDDVITKIAKQVNSGNFAVVYDNSLENDTILKLKSDGYGVRHFQSGMNEYSYEISW